MKACGRLIAARIIFLPVVMVVVVVMMSPVMVSVVEITEREAEERIGSTVIIRIVAVIIIVVTGAPVAMPDLVAVVPAISPAAVPAVDLLNYTLAGHRHRLVRTCHFAGNGPGRTGRSERREAAYGCDSKQIGKLSHNLLLQRGPSPGVSHLTIAATERQRN